MTQDKDNALLPDEIYVDELRHVGGYIYGAYRPEPFEGGVKYTRTPAAKVDVEYLAQQVKACHTPDTDMVSVRRTLNYLASRGYMPAPVYGHSPAMDALPEVNAENADKHAELKQDGISSPVVPDGWMPIESAPKDGTWFLGLIDGIPYKCKAFMNGDMVNYHWCMHTNTAAGQTLRIERGHDGTERKIQIKEADPPKYEPKILAYKLGMGHIPTHWMPLPAAPDKREVE